LRSNVHVNFNYRMYSNSAVTRRDADYNPISYKPIYPTSANRSAFLMAFPKKDFAPFAILLTDIRNTDKLIPNCDATPDHSRGP
jgi:hypothetical protein